MSRHFGFEPQFARVLECIYQVAVAEGAWPSALIAIADFVGATSCDLNFFDSQSFAYKRWEHARIDAETMQRYAAGFMSDMRNVHPRVPVVRRMRAGQVAVDSDLWTPAERVHLPYFAQVFRPAGWDDGITACVQQGVKNRDVIVLGAYFEKRAGTPQAETRRRVEMVLPHVRRACDVSAQLDQARRESAALSAALDRVSEAVAMVDREGRVVRANAAAHAIFRERLVQLSADGRLVLPTSDARAALARALGQCCSALGRPPGTGLAPTAPVVVPRAAGQPLLLTVQPLPKDLAGALGTVALVFINDPDAKLADCSAALRSAYKLTAGEVRLVQSLGEGHSLREYALEHRVSYETARTYLRRAMEKTGVRKQSDLVRITHSLR
jgi:DNA-binding CsgD family transcriptional regulator/PAS domain-containing protein